MGPPTLNPYGLLASEREAGNLLTHALGILHWETEKFRSAIELADFCDAQPRSKQLLDWKELAALQGAVTIYNFHEVLQAISNLIGRCPTAKERMNGERMREARRIFDATFPNFVDVRFSVAHTGKPLASPEKAEKHRLPDVPARVMGFLSGRTLSSIANGKSVNYELTQESYSALHRSAECVFEAFRPVRDFTSRYGREEPRETT